MKSLQHVLQKAHTAILHRADGAAHPSRVGGAVMHPEVIVDPACATGRFPGGSRGGEPTCQPLKVPVPTVRVVVAAPPTAVKEKPTCAPVADLTVGLTLSRGAARLFVLLHEAACEVVAQRSYTALPDAVTFHLPQGLLAAAAGYTDRHVRRLLPELVAAGLIDWGAHASKVRGVSLWDGCLWSVKVRAGDTLPRISPAEWRHQWRDFAGDIDTGNTAKALMSGLHAHEGENDAPHGFLKIWAVNPGNMKSPVVSSSDMAGEEAGGRVPDVREVVYRLGDLMHVHPTKRAERVGRLASALSRALGDTHSRRFYCSVLWQAWRGEMEGRGSLQGLVAALLRLEADRKEWDGLRSPGALLVTRLRAA